MTQTAIPLAKRTKQELVEEYEKMQDQLEELRATAKTVSSAPATELIERAKTKTPQSIDVAFADFQGALHAHLGALRSSILEQSSTLQELQKAVEISRQQLQLQHHVALAADSLDALVEEQAKRTAMFDTTMEQRTSDLDEQIALKKKVWEREAEEYEYQKKMKRERDQAEAAEREKSLAVREAAMRAQELEVAQMKSAIEKFPKELDAAVTEKEDEIVTRLTQQFAHEKALAGKEADARIGLLELTVKNLEERLASQARDIVSLKQQAEEANAKAQALAVKAIERPTTVVAPSSAPVQNPQSSYHDRPQSRG